jgi:(p)ppGpp synthase/HD superfamily hydrolase
MSCDELVKQLGYLSDSPIIKQALLLVEIGHRNQTRIGGGSVLEEHIYPVCSLVLERSAGISGKVLESLLAGTLCHDLLEDTTVSLEQVRQVDGGLTTELVEILTDSGKTPTEYFNQIRQNPLAQVIKVCDRLNNLQCAHKISEQEELLRFCEETEQYVLPMTVLSEDISLMKCLLVELRKIASS